MSTMIKHQELPTNWEKREKLRQKGQFWTPSWVAKAMICYVAKNNSIIFDPAIGKGAFYTALQELNLPEELSFEGFDIDSNIINQAISENIFGNNCSIEIRDFLLNPPSRKYFSIVANPPYLRHHRLSLKTKEHLKHLTYRIMGDFLDGRTGYHVYFLLQSLYNLSEGGRLAFIMPADTAEGVFSKKLWNWITKHYCLECVVTFDHSASPFPGVDTNPLIFFISNSKPKQNIYWVKCLKQYSDDLFNFINSNFSNQTFSTLKIIKQNLSDALSLGLSRDPDNNHKSTFKLLDFAKVMRGIATGANEYFYLNEEQVKKHNLPNQFLHYAISRTRDVNTSEITYSLIEGMKNENKPIYLFSPDGRKINDFPVSVQKYLKIGENKGLPKFSLISTRQPWYKMEKRIAPPFLFAYLGRRNARFIKNTANIIPLTGFLCIYPHNNDISYIDKLWEILQNEDTIKNLCLVGKSYGSGAIKVEPRSLEQLPIPDHLIAKYALRPTHSEDLSFF